jgi:hypothetical protein
MGTNNLGKVMGLILVIPISLFVGAWVLTNPTGAISGLSKLSTIAIAFIALVNPRLGLILLVPQAIYTDEIKRIAVSYGAVSYTTVYEVLLAPLITLGCLNVGYLVGIIFERSRITRGWVLFYVFVAILSGLLFLGADGSLPTRAQLALNNGLYLTLIPLMAAFLNDADEARSFLTSLVWWALPSALWGIHQHYHGLSKMEMDYARTGLSTAHYAQVFLTNQPRPFGFFGSNSGFASVAVFGTLALLYFRVGTSGKMIKLLLAALYLWAAYASKQRTVLLMVPMAFTIAWFFRSRILTKVFYVLSLVLFGLGVIFSDSLLNTGLDKINAAISSNTEWGREVLTVNTFSDRLRGWSRLNKASTYTLLGTRLDRTTQNGIVDVTDSSYNHDVINKILIQTGLVGLFLTTLVVTFFLSKAHRPVYIILDPRARKEASVLLAAVFMIVALSFAGGSILATNPINFLIWSIAGAFLIICRAYSVKEGAMVEDLEESSP